MAAKIKFILISVLIFSFAILPSYANERIRQKIERLSYDNKLSAVYEVFCVPSIKETYLSNEFEPIWSDREQILE